MQHLPILKICSCPCQAGPNALTAYLPDYEKTGDVYSQLSDYTADALQNAKRVEQYHLQNGSSKPFGIAVNPFTDIYQLVESLL